ncbi:MGMT family protein [Verrucomicrobiaceae bacterium R5-34]|nr:MGMT family protein [Verrucomicrobiaceae bacterium R5-34]
MSRESTAFEQSVYALLMKIPEGKVVTYREMARALDCGSAQAIGQALKRNPLAPEVPCHRVIKTDGGIGGYSGETMGPKLKEKLELLASEGVGFDATGKLQDPKRLHHF